jgi:hypothetical protein
MIKNKTVDLLLTLNNKEFKKLGDFIVSPLHNKNRRLIRLYELFRNYYPDFERDDFTKENVYKDLFKDETYKDNMMRKVFSEFSAKVLEFLAYINFTRDKLEQNKHLISELNKRNSNKYFEESFKDAEDALRYPENTAKVLSYRHSLELEKNTRFLKNNKFLFDESLLNESTYLIKYFLLKILRRYTQILNKQIYELKINSRLSFLDEILLHLSENTYEDIPAISLYYNVIMLMLNESEEKYLVNSVNILKGSNGKIEKLDKYNAYFILNNYYRKKEDRGSQKYARELFELYRNQLIEGTYKAEKFIHPTLFLDIVRAGVRLKEFDWVENFICCYIQEIEPHYKDNTLYFSSAMLNFFRKNHQEALKYLSKLKFNGYFHKLDVYCYLLRIYYELNETESMISLIDTFRHVLANDKTIPDYKISQYKYFLKFLSYLSKMKIKDDYSRLEVYKNELVNIHSVSCSGWFWEKYTELGKIHLKHAK